MKAIVAETVESDSKRESASDRRGESVYNTRIQSDRQNTHTTTAQQYTFKYTHILSHTHTHSVRGNCPPKRGGGLGSRPKKMYGERLRDGVEYHLMGPTPLR